MFLDENQTKGGSKRNGETFCCPNSNVASQKRAEAWELTWQCPDDGSGISRYRRWCAWLRWNIGESASGLADTSSRTPRTHERSSRRASATVRPVKTPSRGVWKVTWPHPNRSLQPGRIQRGDRRSIRWCSRSCQCSPLSSLAW